MFRCKVCGWIHEGPTPPNECPSCGATADRFRPMDLAEISAVTGDLSSYGVAGQGYEDIEVETYAASVCWRSSMPRSTRRS